MDEKGNTTPAQTDANAAAAQPAAPAPEAAQPTAAQPVADQTAPVQPEAQAAPTQTQAAPQPAQAVPTQPMPQAVTQPQPAPVAAPANMPSPTVPLVLGILAIIFSWAPIVGIILGIIAIVMAGKYLKAGGTQGTAKGGRICGIVGIVLSVIWFITAMCLTIFGLAVLDNYDTSSRYIETTQSASSSGSFSYMTDADDAEVFAVSDTYMDKLKNKDPETVALIADLFERSFDDIMEDYDINVTLAGCGVDSTALATSMLDGFDYTQDYVLGTGDDVEADYEVTVKSMADILMEFYTEVTNAYSSLRSGATSEQDVYNAIGEALTTAVNNTVPDEHYFSFELEKSGNTWVVDEDSWEDELGYFFSLD